jgi:hypothetical protein
MAEVKARLLDSLIDKIQDWITNLVSNNNITLNVIILNDWNYVGAQRTRDATSVIGQYLQRELQRKPPPRALTYYSSNQDWEESRRQSWQ